MKSGRESSSALLHMVNLERREEASRGALEHSANTPSISLMRRRSSGIESTRPSGIRTVP